MDEERSHSNDFNDDEENSEQTNEEIEKKDDLEEGNIEEKEDIIEQVYEDDKIEKKDNDDEIIKDTEEMIESNIKETMNIENEDKDTEGDKEESNNSKKKRYIIVGSVLLIVVIFSIFVKLFVSRYENVVYPGVTVYGENVSKLNEEELDKKLKELSNKINNNEICINANNENYYIDVKDVVLGYNVNELSNNIITYGKEQNIFFKFYKIITKQNEDFGFKVTINEINLSKLEEKIAKETNKEIQEPQIIINGNDISYKEGKDGSKLIESSLSKDIENELKEDSALSEVINIQAKYEVDKQTITMDDLKKVNSKISTYSTTYSPSGGRGSNVENAAKKLDNMILMPGDEFSYENAVGPVIQSNGYTYAPVISNGSLVQGIGGGVCQVSSTLYNTMLKAGILPTERRNHSKPVSYVPRGLDATLASGSIDYKFVNTLDYPVVINTHCSGGTLTIEFWSNEEALKGIEYEAVSYVSGKTANSYLYGYDKDGNKVYEKHIDTSVYR